MGGLYETDVVEWSERQARLLRGLAARQPSNEVPDWDNIIEELESVGRSELRSVESLLVQALTHSLKVRAWPYSQNVPHWRAEARAFRRDTRRRLIPTALRSDPYGTVSDQPPSLRAGFGAAIQGGMNCAPL